MPVKIRLQRHGKKGKPFFHIVVADSRAPRDGKFVEKIGTYNPGTNPATIELNLERSVKWLQTGAQPTDTARAILSYKGALYKNHLLNGVRKGALTVEQVETKFAAWLESKGSIIDNKINSLANAKAAAKSATHAIEASQKDAKAKAILAKQAASKEAEVTAEEAPAAEETSTEESTEAAAE